LLGVACTSAKAKPALPAAKWIELGAERDMATKFDAALREAKAKGWPVVIDMWAEWCTACKELEHDVIDTPAVKEALAPFMKLRVDTTLDNDAQKALQKRYNVSVLPSIIFLDTKGEPVEAARVSSYVQADVFLRKVAAVKP